MPPTRFHKAFPECRWSGHWPAAPRGARLEIAERAGIGLCTIDTAGTDWPTDPAGGIADGQTVARPRQAGLDVFQRLCEHDSAPVRVRLGDAVITGNTGTNLCDLNVICDTGENGR